VAQKRSTRSSTKGRTGTRRSAPEPVRILDDRSKRDIIGVALCAFAIALMIAVVSRTSGMATEAASGGLKLAFGIGAFLIPIGLLLWGVSFFVRADIRESRTGAGIGIILLALISIAALAPSGPVELTPEAVAAEGGYVGGGFAWLLAKLTGELIAGVLLVGLLVAGLVVTGLSISALIDMLRDRFEPAEEAPARPALLRRVRIDHGACR